MLWLTFFFFFFFQAEDGIRDIRQQYRVADAIVRSKSRPARPRGWRRPDLPTTQKQFTIQRYGIHQGLRWSFRGWHKNGIKDALWLGLGGGWVYGTVVPRGAYRGSFVRRFNCTVASTASMRSPPAAMA